MEDSAENIVSVITTCKGRLHHLKQALPALLAQECQFDYEVIVVDYGCPDGTARWCAALEIPRLKVARLLDGTEHFSPSRARNCGAWLAEGAVLAFVDADIVLAPEWLAVACGSLLRDEAVLCHVEPGKGPWDRNGTCAVRADMLHRVRGYDESLESWGPEAGDFYERVKWENANCRWYPRSLAEPICHDNRERIRFFREKSVTVSLRRNQQRIDCRQGVVNAGGYGLAEVEYAAGMDYPQLRFTGASSAPPFVRATA